MNKRDTNTPGMNTVGWFEIYVQDMACARHRR